MKDDENNKEVPQILKNVNTFLVTLYSSKISKNCSKIREKIHWKDGKLPGYQITADDNADNWREEIVQIRNLILESKRNTG